MDEKERKAHTDDQTLRSEIGGMNTQTTISRATRRRLRMAYITRGLTRHWLIIFLVVYGIFNLLPFLAPIFMHWGWTTAGNAIYDGYSFLCHQMAQRSFFFFGHKIMYHTNELPLQLTGNTGTDTLLLREFRGSEITGWKVAWSDRMVSLYSSVWLTSAAYLVLSHFRRIKPISWCFFGLLVLPMILDGGTHMLSDTTSGLFEGFRYRNEWLADLTVHAFPTSFYVGDALGSFNSWIRLVSGVLFGGGVVGLAFPYIDRFNQESTQTLAEKLRRWDEIQHHRLS
ncbi:MAG TPA: DUF2085 domain-containing protein [Anaerolineaceae bacterium]|nr:DUF2085 domain-containing protein [Anaerolineaceae bacterium]